MISFADLPGDDGFVPAGKWMVQLRDPVSDSFAGATFLNGATVTPIHGALLKRLTVFMPVLGARRVEGEPCDVGDCSAFDVLDAAAADALLDALTAPNTGNAPASELPPDDVAALPSLPEAAPTSVPPPSFGTNPGRGSRK